MSFTIKNPQNKFGVFSIWDSLFSIESAHNVLAYLLSTVALTIPTIRRFSR